MWQRVEITIIVAKQVYGGTNNITSLNITRFGIEARNTSLSQRLLGRDSLELGND